MKSILRAMAALLWLLPPPLTAAEDPIPRPAPLDPPPAEAIEGSIRRGVDFLLETQNRDGSWGNATRTKGLNIYAPAPGAHQAFRSATTCLGVMALIESADDRERVDQAIERAEIWLGKELPRVRRATPDAMYNVWSHAYATAALLHLRRRGGDNPLRRAALDELLRRQIQQLGRYESVNGGWCYYDFRVGSQRPAGAPNSFTTASVLIPLLEARDEGFDVSQKMIDRAVATIRRQRKPDGTYLYSGRFWARPMSVINRPGGSLGRSQVCNLALRAAGDVTITDQVLVDWLDRLFARNLWLEMGRKRPVPHESHYAVAGYFFYYGHYYAAGCIGELPADTQPRFQAHLATRLIALQEKDGSWWDFPIYNYHQPYGTSFALMALAACRE